MYVEIVFQMNVIRYRRKNPPCWSHIFVQYNITSGPIGSILTPEWLASMTTSHSLTVSLSQYGCYARSDPLVHSPRPDPVQNTARHPRCNYAMIEKRGRIDRINSESGDTSRVLTCNRHIKHAALWTLPPAGHGLRTVRQTADRGS